METVLLHSCCAPCSAAIIEWMLKNDITPVVYYYNPNIFPRDEYEKRKGEITRYCEKLGIRVIDGDWEHDLWRERVRGLELEPERGARCQCCFDLKKPPKNAASSGSNALQRRLPQAAGRP